MKHPTLQPILWVCVLLVLGIGTAQAQTTRYVDATLGNDAANDCSVAVSPCQTIAHALSEASSGDTIELAAGTYEEQVHITMDDVTITGAGSGSNDATNSIIKSPATLTESFMTGSNTNYPVVFVDGATGAVIENVRIDGAGRGNANNRFIGVGFWNGDGTLQDCTVTGVRETPLNGNQHGVAVYAFNNTGGPYSVTTDDCVIDDFQKNAFSLNGTGLTVDIKNNTVTGAGPLGLGLPAQNGIQVSFGAGGTVMNNTISDIAYTGSSAVATAMLIFDGTTVDAANNAITDSQANIYYINTSGTIDGNSVSSPATVGLGSYAAVLDPFDTQADDRLPTPQPFGQDDVAAGKSAGNSAMMADVTQTFNNNLLTGTSAAGSIGILMYSSGETLEVTGSGNLVKAFDFGVFAGEGTPGDVESIDFTGNCIIQNLSYGMEAGTQVLVNAEDNYWGTSDGPSGDGTGTGDKALGNLDFMPFATTVPSITGCEAKPVMTIVVGPNTSGWSIDEETPTGTGSYVLGPDTPPAGIGSVQFMLDTGGVIVHSYDIHQGLRFDELTDLAYSTYRQTASSVGVVPTLQFDVDYDLTDTDGSWQGRLVFEPLYSGSGVPPEDTWQTWDPLNAPSGWWATGSPGNGLCTESTSGSCSLAEVLAAYPNAGIRAVGGVGIKAGSGWASGFKGNTDRLVIGTSSVVKIYDFEPDCDPSDAPSWDGNFTGGETVGGGSSNGRGYMLVETLNGFTESSLNLGQSTNIALLDVTRADGTTLPVSDLTYTNPLSGPDGSGFETITYTGPEKLESVRIYVTWLNEGNSRFMYQTSDQCGFTSNIDPAMAFGTPEEFELNGNYPNPFNPQTTIRFTLPEAANVTLEVFDVMGRRIQTLVSGRMDAGFHSAVWNGTSASGVPVASGIYLYRIQAGDFSAVQQMILMK